MMRVAIIQARMSSTRMPGKVLAELGGLPLIVFMARRVQRARRVERVIVATSTEASDDPLAQAVARHGIECFRGSLEDVLDRYYQAARAAGADHVVRLTGDCPLIDADLIDATLVELDTGDCDYVSNLVPAATHPDGLSVEACTMAALEKSWRQARLASEREHPTTWLRKPENGARIRALPAFADLSELRWTVDYADDLQYVRDLLAAIPTERHDSFDRFDVYRAIETHGLRQQPAHRRYEAYAKSLAEDRVVVTPAGVPAKPA